MGFEELVKTAQSFQLELKDAGQEVGGGGLKLFELKSSFLRYLKDLFSKKRVSVTHLLVFMIADERRNCKPYNIPVHFLSYKLLTCAKLQCTVRELEVQLEEAIRRIGMTVVGMCQ